MWSKFCHKFYETVVELLLHKAKALTHLRMHSMMVLKKSNDNSHLKFSKYVMISSQMLFIPSKPNPLQKIQMILEFYSSTP
jgi:regulatory protein YycH of two-component signal transduction system YycFG